MSSAAPAADQVPHGSTRKNLFLVDWDDTLLASSWLAECSKTVKDNAEVSKLIQQLQELEQRVFEFLIRVLALGRVVLVTNALSGWVERSCSKYLPKVLALLPHIKIVSARSQYERMFPNRPGEWKLAAFRDIFRRGGISKERGVETSVISVGDSVFERDAVHIAAKELLTVSPVLVKSIQFMSRPAAAELASQLEILNGCIAQVCECNSNLDLMLQKTLRSSIL